MSDLKRRKQNRDAQRRFRDKQAKQAQLSREEFEKLKSKYEALLTENKSIKSRQLGRSDPPTLMSEEPLQEPLGALSLGWESDSLPPSSVLKLTDGIDDLFSMDAHSIRLCTPNAEEMVEDAVFASGTENMAFSANELQDTILPTVEHPEASACVPSVVRARGVPCLGQDSGPRTFDTLPLTDASVELDYSTCDTMLFRPSLPPSFGTGVHNTITNGPPIDFVQALIQLAFAQERIALIDLEKAKLRAEAMRTASRLERPRNLEDMAMKDTTMSLSLHSQYSSKKPYHPKDAMAARTYPRNYCHPCVFAVRTSLDTRRDYSTKILIPKSEIAAWFPRAGVFAGIPSAFRRVFNSKPLVA
ncbi:hypothetical protein GQ44DRAFT_779328 [Phaeosphaeriaceae sp. PMI808]|nr:hypothetical protein GQ44DRAFT_779328 [Phaeosphaeriaceae sp. PMI808]